MSYCKKSKMTYSAHIGLALALVVSIISTGCSQKAPAAENVSAQTTFTTPAEAGEALQTASRAHDERSLGKILGEGSAAILSSGDPAEDQAGTSSGK